MGSGLGKMAVPVRANFYGHSRDDKESRTEGWAEIDRIVV